MALPNIVTPTSTAPAPSWVDLRRGIKRCILAGAPNARVYSRWALKYNIGQTLELLKSPSDAKRIHAWLVAVASARPFQHKMGGHVVEWEITLRIWGFMGYAFGSDDNNTQNILEEEARRVGNILFLNRQHLGMENPTGLSDVGTLVFEDIDVHAAGDGVDFHVAQGTLTLRITEQLLV